jgi:hypothetical protein
VRGQHGRNVHRVEQFPDGLNRKFVAAQFVKRVSERHGRTYILSVVSLQAAHALALLTKIDKVKEKAEGVSNVRGRGNVEPLHLELARFEELGVDIEADLFGEVPEILDGVKSCRSTLLLHDHAQASRQQANFTS